MTKDWGDFVLQDDQSDSFTVSARKMSYISIFCYVNAMFMWDECYFGTGIGEWQNSSNTPSVPGGEWRVDGAWFGVGVIPLSLLL